MADKPAPPDGTPTPPTDAVSAPTTPVPPKRGPGHRGADVKDTVAEMAAKAHEISLEAGSKMAAAMKDVVNAAAGITGFVLESARDLVQYMVRRGQMTQEEADKLIRQAEEAQANRPPSEKGASKAPETAQHGDGSTAESAVEKKSAPKIDKPAAKPVEKSAEKPVAKKVEKSAKPAAKGVEKAAPAAKKVAAKVPAKKAAAKKK